MGVFKSLLKYTYTIVIAIINIHIKFLQHLFTYHPYSYRYQYIDTCILHIIIDDNYIKNKNVSMSKTTHTRIPHSHHRFINNTNHNNNRL